MKQPLLCKLIFDISEQMLYNTTKGYFIWREYMDYDSPVSRFSTTVRFVAVALVLVVLLLLGVFLSKSIVTSMNEGSKPNVATTDKKDTSKVAGTDNSEKIAAEKAANEQKKADEAEKARLAAEAETAKQEAEAKKKADEAAAAKAKEEAAAAQAAQTVPSVASTGPSEVASTGPEEAIPYLIAIAALSYAGYIFIRSKKQLFITKELRARSSIK